MREIPKYDPLMEKSRLLRSMEAFAASTPGTWIFKHMIAKVEPLMIRVSGGRLQVGAGPRVNVTVPGRKSGEPRTTTLLYFTRGEDVILIASNFGGPKPPSWYHNLTAAGEAQLAWNGGEGRYLVRETEEPERTELYELAKQLYHGYGTYEERVEGIRTIPVLVLTPA